MSIQVLTKNKKYSVRVHFRDSLGRPRDKQRIVNGTYKDALLVEAQMEEEAKNGFSSYLSFHDLSSEYFEQKKKNVKKETLRKEKEIYKKYLYLLSNVKVNNITPFSMLELRNHIDEINGSITQKNKAIYLLKRILDYGEKYYNFDNHSVHLDLFDKKVKDKFIYNTYTPEEFNYVLDFIKEDNYKLFYEICFWTGLRRGEALALRPNDLLPSKELRVNKSLNSFKQVGTPKNESSFRNVKIHDQLYHKLLPYSKSKGLSLLGGMEYLPPSTINGKLTRAIKAANKKRENEGLYELPHIRVHDLRHSHATFLASQGAPITAVSARLGHSSINETMNTYVHLFKGDDDRMVEIIDSYIDN